VDTVDLLASLPQVKVTSSLLSDLATAIRVRSRVSAARREGGDSGHAYFVAVLNYWWVTLQNPGIFREGEPDPEEEKQNNPFHILTPDDDDDIDYLNDILPTDQPITRPVQPEKQYSLRELVTGSDSIQVHLFFVALDEMMAFMITKYRSLKRNLGRRHGSDIPLSSFVEHIMECTV